MGLNVTREVAALERLTTNQLRAKYAEICGESTSANNKPWLVKRIAWRMQALAEGGLSERARQRAAELANDADLRTSAPKSDAKQPKAYVVPLKSKADRRLPPTGTVITREYKGKSLRVTVLDHGFDYDGIKYPTLSAVAKVITGSHCNGFHFFRLTGGKR